MNFTEGVASEIEEIVSRYPSRRSALLPVLRIAQRESGCLSLEALEAVAEALRLPKAYVRGVATFHTMFRTRPLGRNIIRLCTNVTCSLFASERLLSVIKEKFAVEPGGTTRDGRFSLVEMECLGACDAPPAMLVNSDLHMNLTPENITRILESYE